VKNFKFITSFSKNAHHSTLFAPYSYLSNPGKWSGYGEAHATWRWFEECVDGV